MSEIQEKYILQAKKVLGIDPGISNTGFVVIHRPHRTSDFMFVDSQLLKTNSASPRPLRLNQIFCAACDFISRYKPDFVAIENVFHNKNISSSMTTAMVISACELAAFKYDIPVQIFTPQQVKRAVGVWKDSDKKEMLRHVALLLGGEFKSHHLADAAACAIAGILKMEVPS